jgi:hypothetical protein
LITGDKEWQQRQVYQGVPFNLYDKINPQFSDQIQAIFVLNQQQGNNLQPNEKPLN